MTAIDPKSRLVSLDAFRGATIAAMILVNNPGSMVEIFDPLEHSIWHGWSFTDCIFPAFLWMVGVAMVFSSAKRMEQGANCRPLVIHVLKRSAIIFALGIFITDFPFGLFLDPHFSLANMRIPGVLQRIAVCYLLCGLIFFFTGIRGQIIWTLGLLIGYWGLLKWAHVPGYGAGVLEPEGNLCWYVDSLVLGDHTYGSAIVKGFDPEGIVSTLGALATTLFGVLAGHWLLSATSKDTKTAGMLLAAAALIGIGLVMSIWLPINKNLWTSSFAIFMAGISMACIGLLCWLIDIKGYRRWATPFTILGMNALAIYVLSCLIARFLYLLGWPQPDGSFLELREFLSLTLFESWAGAITGSLLYAITYVLMMYGVAWAMWRRRIFIKI